MLEKDKDNFPSHLNYDLLELPTELFQVSKKNKKALAELGSDSKRMNSGLKKKGKSGYPCPSQRPLQPHEVPILFRDNLYESLPPLTSLMALFYLSARRFIILLL